MNLHAIYLIAVSAVFVAVFAVMLHSLIRYRKPGDATRRFSGPTGRVQWLWALVPMLILGAVNIVLIERAIDPHHPIELAAVRK